MSTPTPSYPSAPALIQRYWALPPGAVARLDFKDILGYLIVARALYIGVVTAAFLLFL